MYFLISVNSKDAASMLKLLESFELVEITPLTEEGADILAGLQNALRGVKAIKEGKAEGVPNKVTTR